MKWLALVFSLFVAGPALAQSPGFTGWQSGVFDTAGIVMPAQDTLRNYLSHMFCSAFKATTPVELNIKTMRNGVLTTIGYVAIETGSVGDFNFNPPLWGDVGAAITVSYRTGGGPAHCTWGGFQGQ